MWAKEPTWPSYRRIVLGIADYDRPPTRIGAARPKIMGFDTLEVFTPDSHFLTYSAQVLRRIWDQDAANPVRLQSAAG